jgi:hypothetical protein
VEYRDKELLTVLGQVKVKRAYYYDRRCKKGFCPKDKTLDIEGASFSPGPRRIMGRVGAYRPFALGHEDIKEMAGISVNAKEVERTSHRLGEEAEGFYREQADLVLSDKVVPFRSVPKMYVLMDGTGVPVVKKETVGRKGKGEDGTAKTREAKLGCVFTQTTVDGEGNPVRDEGSTSYVGAIEGAEEFGRRGLWNAEEVCVIGDGAPWIWNLADEHFPEAVHIIDLYHARQRYWDVARTFFANDAKRLNRWAERRRKELDEGNVEAVIRAIKRLTPSAEQAESWRKGIDYFKKNKDKDAICRLQRTGTLCRLRGSGGGLQNGNRPEAETVGNALDGKGGQQHNRPALFAFKQPLGGLLGVQGQCLGFYP